MPRRSGLEKLSSEQASVTKAKGQSFIHLVFSDQIEFRCRYDGSRRDGREQQWLHCCCRNCHLKWPASSLRRPV